MAPCKTSHYVRECPVSTTMAPPYITTAIPTVASVL